MYAGNYGTPGQGALRVTEATAVTWQEFFHSEPVIDPFCMIVSTAVDAGATPTTLLRPGLIMAKVDATGLWSTYDPDASDGTQYARGVLLREIDMFNYGLQAVENKFDAAIAIGGRIKGSALKNADQQARNQLVANGFRFDDVAYAAGYMRFRRVQEKAADYTVLTTDHETLFVATTGAVNFTLPAIAAGLRYLFLNTTANNMVITSPTADNIIAVNDLSADSLTFSTSNMQIGAALEITAIYVGGVLKWFPSLLSPGVTTVTVGT